MKLDPTGISPYVIWRYYYDAEYHGQVHLVGYLCWWVGRFRARVG